jgi:gliding motility-associated-like protein
MPFFLNRFILNRFLSTMSIVCLVALFNVGSAQTECVLIESIDIVDNETQAISFTISGVQLDDLSDDNQNITSIQIEFNHQKVTDLGLTLVSPSNQEIDLIGPITGSNELTSGIPGWGIEFLPCGIPAAPDPRINDDIYSNLLNWENFEFYSGSYYPFSGCLEDFNVGSVNGKWTLIVSDGFRFDDGFIASIKIIFSQPEGLEFSVCEANAGIFDDPGDFNNPIPLCDFKNDLFLSDFMITNFRRPDNQYNYEFIIVDLFSDDIISVQEGTPDLRSNQFPLGDYQICALSYNVDDRAAIFDELDNGKLDDFREFIEAVPSPVCADVTEICLTISKLPIANFVTIDTTICTGGEFRLEDSEGLIQRYFEPIQNDSLAFGAQACDSVVIVNIQQIDIEAVISTDTDTIINCVTDTIVLGSSMSIVDGPPDRLWSTSDGEIIGDNTMQQIRTNTPGTYRLMISTDQGCMDAAEIVIGQNMDQAVVDLMANGIITCENSVVELMASSEEQLFNSRWTGPDIDSDGVFVEVFDEGLYTFTAEFDNGCSFEDTIRVDKDIAIPDFVVDLITVGCRRQIQFANNMIPQGANWISPSDELLSEVMPIISEQGVYELIVESQNGCIDTVDVDIQFDRPVDTLQIRGSILSCTDTATILSVNSENTFNLISWEGPDFFELADSVSVSTLGTYIVRTQDIDNCPGIGEFELVMDTLQPFIEINGRTLGCTATETSLTADIGGLSNPIEWQGPNFQDVGFDVRVSEVGEYIAATIGQNGCIGTDTFLLTREEPFDVNVRDTLINCDLSSVRVEAEISISPQQVQWDGPDGFSSSEAIIEVEQIGTYFLTVTGADRCNVVDTLQVGFRTPDLSFNEPEDDFVINCDADSIQLQLDITGEFESVFWITESLDILTEIEPFVSEAGIYQIEVEDAFGCSIDTSIVVQTDTVSPTVMIDQFGTFACEQNEVTLTADIDMVGSPIVVWQGENGPLPDQENITQTVQDPGTYMVRVFNPSNLCFSEDEVTLVEEDNSFTDLELDFINPCGDQATGAVQVVNFVGGEGPYELSLDNDLFEEADQLGGLLTGSYELFARDVNGCTFSKPFELEQSPEIDVELPEEISVMFNELVEIGIDTMGLNIVDITWGQNNQFLANGVDSINFQAQEDATIQVFLRTIEGCESSSRVEVLVSVISRDIHLPTAFKPSSEANGLFQFGVNQGITTVLELTIFDRWGNLVYNVANVAADSDYGWNGMFNGELAEQDTYVYYAELQAIDGEVEAVNGTFYLFR